jgi:adenine-specific DNA-methyltransferase
MLAPTALAEAPRWSPLLRGDNLTAGARQTPLSTLARVHRGIATGANDYFVLTRGRAAELGILRWCRPAITRAEEILSSGGVIRDTPDRRLLLLIPPDIDRHVYPQLDAYLERGETEPRGKDHNAQPVARTYLSAHRKPWWYLGPVKTPAIVATYMARQAPAFACNPDGLVLLNVAHGIYPHSSLSHAQLVDLVDQLNALRESFRGMGRTYHGGLEKFEPREMEGLLLTLNPDGADATA